MVVVFPQTRSRRLKVLLPGFPTRRPCFPCDFCDVHHVLRTFHRSATLWTQPQEKTGPTGSSWSVPLTPALFRHELPTVSLLQLCRPIAFTAHSPKPTSRRGDLLGPCSLTSLVPFGVSSPSPCQGLIPIVLVFPLQSKFKRVYREWSYSLDQRVPRCPHLSPYKSLHLTSVHL